MLVLVARKTLHAPHIEVILCLLEEVVARGHLGIHHLIQLIHSFDDVRLATDSVGTRLVALVERHARCGILPVLEPEAHTLVHDPELTVQGLNEPYVRLVRPVEDVSILVGDCERCFEALFEEVLVLGIALIVIHSATVVLFASDTAIIVYRNIIDGVRHYHCGAFITEESCECLGFGGVSTDELAVTKEDDVTEASGRLLDLLDFLLGVELFLGELLVPDVIELLLVEAKIEEQIHVYALEEFEVPLAMDRIASDEIAFCFLRGELAVGDTDIDRLFASLEELECLDALMSCEDRAVCVDCRDLNEIELLETFLESHRLLLGDRARALLVSE